MLLLPELHGSPTNRWSQFANHNLPEKFADFLFFFVRERRPGEQLHFRDHRHAVASSQKSWSNHQPPPLKLLRPKESCLISAGLRPASIDKACAGFFFGRLARVELGKANLVARPHFDCRRFHRYLATKSCSRNFRMAGAAIAPARCATSIPFLKIDIVGIAVTRKRRAKLGSSSVLTLATRT